VIDGERGRVPFALVAVLLLVGSATLSASLGPRQPRPADPARERAVEEATAAARTALRAAAREAGRHAAANPVIERANTTAGGVLRPGQAFRDALRIRLYLAAARRFERVHGRAGPVTATVRLTRPENATALGRVMQRASVAKAGPNDAALRAGVANATVIVRRGGRVVERRRFSPSVVVGSPVLLVHDRASAFQRRLRADAVAPGLTRRLTARLYALTWGRGFAQFRGAPIENVVASRHVAHATNAALIAEQRRAFGRSDRAARRAYRAMAGNVLGRDLLRAAGLRPRTADAVTGATDAALSGRREWTPTTWGGDAPTHRGSMSVSAAVPASRALVDFLDGGLAGVLDRTYRARIRASSTVLDRDAPSRSGRERPSGDGDWERVEENVTTDCQVRNRTVAPPEVAEGWHALETYGRRVVRTETTTRTWKSTDSNATETTRETVRRGATVRVSVVGQHTTNTRVPRRGIDPIHERGGPLDGPNFAGIRKKAIDQVVEGRGGRAELACEAVARELNTSAVTIEAERPDGLRAWVVRDLLARHGNLSDTAITAERGAVGTFEADPHADLTRAVRADEGGSAGGQSGPYGGAATKARAAARAAYLDRVIDQLKERARQRRRARDRLDGLLAEYGLSVDALSAARNATEDVGSPSRDTVEGLGGEVTLSIDAAPPYLPATGLDADRIDAPGNGTFYGVRARNVNVFSVPYDDVSDSATSALAREGPVRLRVAAGTLRGANRLAAVRGVDNATLDDRRRTLRTTVRSGLDQVRTRFRERLNRMGIGGSPADREALVATALSEWETPAARALAATNGSAARALVDLAVERYDGPLEDHLVRTRLRASLADASRGVTVSGRTTRRLVGFVGEEFEWAADQVATDRLGRYVERRVGTIPAGLPLVPVPGYWYATTNVWVVRARGGYARFTVRADRGPPGASLAYTRDGSAVRLDVDADGERERLGRASRVTFDATTAVTIVVPPGPPGVGDVDGDADERSPGWG